MQLIRNDDSMDYLTTDNFKGEHLFKQGATFDMDTYHRQFANNITYGRLDSGVSLGWSFEVVNITSSGNTASATIRLTRA